MKNTLNRADEKPLAPQARCAENASLASKAGDVLLVEVLIAA